MAAPKSRRLILLPEGLTRQYVVPFRYSAQCRICGQPFIEHDTRFACDCGRCGVQFSWDCYWPRVASAQERQAFERATEPTKTRSGATSTSAPAAGRDRHACRARPMSGNGEDFRMRRRR